METAGATPFAMVLDDAGRILDADDAAVALLGPDRADLVGRPLADRLAPEHVAAATAEGSGATEAWCGRRVDGLPWCAWVNRSAPRGGDGRLFVGHRRFGPVRWVGSPAPDPPPSGPGLDTVLSHDLRGALRQARGFTTVARRALDDPERTSGDEPVARVVDHLGIVARSLASADQLAEQVVRALRWSDRPLSVDAAPLGPLVDEAAATAGVAVAAPPAAADVLVDRELVTWAVTELLVNARTFAGGDAATVEVAARPAPPGWCELVVRDDGPGIADDLLDDAFQPGRQLQARGEVTGVGMGLALCRLVFERHAGWCRAEPVTTGTTIAVRLPAADGAARR